MGKINNVEAIEVLDSRGFPTLQVVIHTEKGNRGKVLVPSGASKGAREAVEVRDHDPKRFKGKGVLKAVGYVNGPLRTLLLGKEVCEQEEIDRLLIKEDGDAHKAHFGANSLIGISLATLKAAAADRGKPLYAYLSEGKKGLLPLPMMNIINGGVHADNGLAFQEFMIVPHKAPSFKEAIRWGSEVFHTLKLLLKEKKMSTSVGDEGGFAPPLSSHKEALEWIVKAIEQAGYTPGKQISLALDCAASEFYDPKTKRYMHYSTAEYCQEIENLCRQYPIISIEDPLEENDWEEWKQLTEKLGKKIQIVGDDLFVSQKGSLEKGIAMQAGNAILLKPNQVGTFTEMQHTFRLAKEKGYKTILSHRSGETEDTTIADLAVGMQTGQIKTGSLSRSERVAKYNRLLEIEQEMGSNASFYTFF